MYQVNTVWLGNRGTGTSAYRAYGRESEITADGKHTIVASADRTFHGNADRWNPEELLVAALSECHMLSFLHVAVQHNVVVTDYWDTAEGRMRTHPDGSGEFTEVILHPEVTTSSAIDDATFARLHHEASEKCFIARSVAFPVRHQPRHTHAPV